MIQGLPSLKDDTRGRFLPSSLSAPSVQLELVEAEALEGAAARAAGVDRFRRSLVRLDALRGAGDEASLLFPMSFAESSAALGSCIHRADCNSGNERRAESNAARRDWSKSEVLMSR